MGLNTPFSKKLKGSVVWNPASLVDGAGETQAVTVAGAAVGDYVVVAPGVDIQEMVLSASVSAANTVEIRLQNETGGTIDLASSTFVVTVFMF